MNFTDASAIWQIEVVNPGISKNSPDKTSNWYPFQVTGTGSASPAVLDDYPYKNAPFDPTQSPTCKKGTNDQYGFCYRECTSYVAWRMNRDAATTDLENPSFFNTMAGGHWIDAANWGGNAGSLGYKPDPSPQAGDIAQWVTIDHVAYVESVNSDGSIDVSEYNYGADDGGIKHQYGVRRLSSALGNLPDEFIHISRVSVSPTSLTFGSQAVGASSSKTISVTNSSSATISIAVAVANSVTGVGTGDFTVGGACDGASLAPGAECDLTVTFAPPPRLQREA